MHAMAMWSPFGALLHRHRIVFGRADGKSVLGTMEAFVSGRMLTPRYMAVSFAVFIRTFVRAYHGRIQIYFTKRTV